MKRYGPGAIASGKCAIWSFTSSSTGPRARSRGFRVSRSIRATASAAEAVIAALRRAATVLALSALSAGCANFSAISPGDSAHSVEARVGPPAAVWKNADGSEVDRKSTRLNSSHVRISYAVFCLKKKKSLEQYD